MSFLYWLEESIVGVWVAQSWGYPFMLCCHAVGMAIVVGTVSMFNIRLLGYSSTVPLAYFVSLARITLAGVILNLLSGLALFSGNPGKFVSHPAFWIKIALIILGALSLWWELHIVRQDRLTNSSDDKATRIKVIAGFSIVFWLGAIVAGRLIAYFKLF